MLCLRETLRRKEAVLLHWAEAAVASETDRMTFRGNRALYAGGGISMYKSHLTFMSITTTTFVDNKCDDLDHSFGGAIMFNIVTGNIVVVKDSHFLNNFAMYGGQFRSSISGVVRIMLSWRRSQTPPSTSSTIALLCATGLTLPLVLEIILM